MTAAGPWPIGSAASRPAASAAPPPAASAGPEPAPSTAGSVVGDLLELDVGAVGHGGFCVARLDRLAVFVRHTLPGERVRAKVTEVRRSYLRADAVEILRAAPERVVPPCPYAGPGRCGGCDWQHAVLPAQRELKAAVVREQFARLAGLDVEVAVEEVPGATDGLGWRTRVGFAVRRDGVVGLHRHRSHSVQPVERCLIAAPAVESVGAESARWPGVAELEVEVSAAGERLVVVTPARAGRLVLPELDDDVGVLRRTRSGTQPVAEPSVLRERADGRDYLVSGGGFWQVHPGAATVLVAAVLAALAPRPGERVLDLYAGAGLFSLALADAVGSAGTVVAVESGRVAADDARSNLAGQPQATVLWAEVTAGLSVWSPVPDLVVLDPPRAGAGPQVTRALAGCGARAVAYVACDPAALARDTAVLLERGWRLVALRAYDLFPMTAHVECVALFEPDSMPGSMPV